MFRANFQRTGVYLGAHSLAPYEGAGSHRYQTTGIHQLRGLKWSVRESPEIENWSVGWIVGCNWHLAVEGEVVCASSPGGNLYGLDPQTGQQLWKYQIGKEKKIFPLGIASGVVYLAYRQLDSAAVAKDEYLLAINVQTGRQTWYFKLPFQTTTQSFNSIASSGECLWSFKTTKNMVLSSPAIDEGILCSGCMD